VRIDHVTVAGRDLDALRDRFASVGLISEYGGEHSNGITHMAVVGLPDGSYIELIASRDPSNHDHAFWPGHIAEDAGACAWAIEVDDVSAESTRLRERGIGVEGPHRMSRRRPDGRAIEWDLAFLGQSPTPGIDLPFMLRDRTPRAWRVQTTPGMEINSRRGADVAHSERRAEAERNPDAAGQREGEVKFRAQPEMRKDGIVGAARVLIAVRDFAAFRDRFQRAFNWSTWEFGEDLFPGTQAMHALDGAVSLVKPAEVEDASITGTTMRTDPKPDQLEADPEVELILRRRLARLGEGPIGFLIDAVDLDAAARRFSASVDAGAIGSRRVRLINPNRLAGALIGLIESARVDPFTR